MDDELQLCLDDMKEIYDCDPVVAVCGQHFIQRLHDYIEADLNSYLSPKARRLGIKVEREAHIYGSYKAKDVDVAVISPVSGPLITVGVRSQMTSVGKNVLTYYQDIVGECISIQERFPMTTMGYVYLHPLMGAKDIKHMDDLVPTDYRRWSRLYGSISGRDDSTYKLITGHYDHFAYMLTDFRSNTAHLCDDLVARAEPNVDLSIRTFTRRLVETFVKRNIWLDDLFDIPSDDATSEGD